MMQENSFDPSHSNYVHGSTFQKREDAMPMRAKLITKVMDVTLSPSRVIFAVRLSVRGYPLACSTCLCTCDRFTPCHTLSMLSVYPTPP